MGIVHCRESYLIFCELFFSFSNTQTAAKQANFPGNQNRLGIPGSPSSGPPMPTSSAGPLQFLEKTTTSIGNNPR